LISLLISLWLHFYFTFELKGKGKGHVKKGKGKASHGQKGKDMATGWWLAGCWPAGNINTIQWVLYLISATRWGFKGHLLKTPALLLQSP